MKPANTQRPVEPDGSNLFADALCVAMIEHQASVSLIQRRLKLGYTLAVDLVEMMVREGMISASMDDSGNRTILWTEAQIQSFLASRGWCKTTAICSPTGWACLREP
ncbi:MAG: DNA translocase FtsK [Hydrogenophaga sp.]|uniref:DNA translocase FtsK n=1 Tax=Hydrogenophaga sp. TaxID=1904254 RepID=UPI0040365F0B